MSSHPGELAQIQLECAETLAEWAACLLDASDQVARSTLRAAQIAGDLGSMATALGDDAEACRDRAQQLCREVATLGEQVTQAIHRAQADLTRADQLKQTAESLEKHSRERLARAEAALRKSERDERQAQLDVDTAEHQVNAAQSDLASARSALSNCENSGYYDYQNKRQVQPNCSSQSARVTSAQLLYHQAGEHLRHARDELHVAYQRVQLARNEVRECERNLELARRAVTEGMDCGRLAANQLSEARGASELQQEAGHYSTRSLESAHAAMALVETMIVASADTSNAISALGQEEHQLRDLVEEHTQMSARAHTRLLYLQDLLRRFDFPEML